MLIFYRCELCRHVVSPWDIESGGCGHCGGVRIRPTNLTIWEKIKQMAKHPRIWEWRSVTAGQTGQAAK